MSSCQSENPPTAQSRPPFIPLANLLFRPQNDALDDSNECDVGGRLPGHSSFGLRHPDFLPPLLQTMPLLWYTEDHTTGLPSTAPARIFGNLTMLPPGPAVPCGTGARSGQPGIHLRRLPMSLGYTRLLVVFSIRTATHRNDQKSNTCFPDRLVVTPKRTCTCRNSRGRFAADFCSQSVSNARAVQCLVQNTKMPKVGNKWSPPDR
jgi:hypothetical protein